MALAPIEVTTPAIGRPSPAIAVGSELDDFRAAAGEQLGDLVDAGEQLGDLVDAGGRLGDRGFPWIPGGPLPRKS